MASRPEKGGGGPRLVLAIAGFNVAVFLAVFAVTFSLLTYTPEAERGGLWTAVAIGAASIGLVALSSRRMPRGGIPIVIPVVGIACSGIWVALARLLG